MIPTRSARTSGLLEVLGGQEDGDLVLAREPSNLVPERRAALDVEPGRRLVEEENARAMHERHCEIQSALHPARIAADLAVGRMRQSDARDQLVGALVTLAARKRLERRLQAKVLAASQQPVERGLL
jgi:hypothetical protein